MQKPTDYAAMAIYLILPANPSFSRPTTKVYKRLKTTAAINIIQQRIILQSGGNMGPWANSIILLSLFKA